MKKIKISDDCEKEGVLQLNYKIIKTKRIKMRTELFTPDTIDILVNTGKTLITSPAVQGVVSSLIMTLFVRRGENAKVVAALKAKEFKEVTEELLKTGRLSYVELYKCRNFLEIAKREDEMISVCYIDNKEYVEDDCNEQDNFSFDC